ncbi:MAG: FxSxx-COOH system tetratricopeptide repeat protein [Actinoplanes sp.]
MGTPVDLFVSYAGPDRPWAEWAAQQLEAAGYTVELDAWDWAAGANAVLKMNDALARARRVLALYSPAYFDRDRFAVDEWTAVLAERPDTEGRRRLVPVRVAKVEPPPILRATVYRDLFDLPETRARQALIEAVSGPARPIGGVRYPGGPAAGIRVPGSLPEVWNVRRRNPLFTGRSRELAGLRERLCSNERALVQSLHGIGGVGKTELAVEYAHLFGNEYALVWWIDAERPELIGEQLAALGLAASWITEAAVAVDVVVRRLQHQAGWLLIYDNAEAVDAIAPYIPGGTGQVIITTRSRGHGGIASPVEVDVLDQETSMARLRAELPALPERDAELLAAEMQGLPLALGQAAGFLAETGMSVDDYLREMRINPVAALNEGPTGQYSASLPAVVATSMRVISERDPAARQLMRLVAVLAPEAIPLRWLSDAPAGVLPEPLGAVAANGVAWRRTLGRLANLGLARVDADRLQVHRLVQAIVASSAFLTDIEQADRLLEAAVPSDVGDPTQWPRWAELLPHLLVRAPSTTNMHLRMLSALALLYLLLRGEYRTAQSLGRTWHQQWRRGVGQDELSTMVCAQHVANAHMLLGDLDEARRLAEDTLNRLRRVFGAANSYTLDSSVILANVLSKLGENERARRLTEDVLDQRRQTLGEDNPSTLESAYSLAHFLAKSGENERARLLVEDTLNRQRQILGDAHPETRNSAVNLTIYLDRLGFGEEARQLKEEIRRWTPEPDA